VIPPDLTAAQLLSWILAALLLQAGVGVGVAIWRRPRSLPGADLAPGPLPQATGTSAWAGIRLFKVIARQHEDAAHSQCSFHLQPVDGKALPEFRPGQFLTFVLQIPESASAGGARAVTRCYSLSDAPAADHYRVSIKRVPPPPGRPELASGLSSNHFHDHVQVGDVLQVKAPSGHFYHPIRRAGPGGRHRHHADDEHAALVHRRAAAARGAPLLRAAQQSRTRLRRSWSSPPQR
jgi:hypothetical protein